MKSNIAAEGEWGGGEEATLPAEADRSDRKAIDGTSLPDAVTSLVGRGTRWEVVTVGMSTAAVYRAQWNRIGMHEVGEAHGGDAASDRRCNAGAVYLKVDRAAPIAAEAERMRWLSTRM